MPWIFFTSTFAFAIVAGFAAFSRGAVFKTELGIILQGVLSLTCFAFIGWAILRYGVGIGLAEVVVIFVGAAAGKLIFSIIYQASRRW